MVDNKVVIPKSIIILGRKYKIIETNDSIDGDKSKNLVWGRIYFKEKIIKIYNNGDPYDVWDSIIHEIMHAVDYHIGSNISHGVITGISSILSHILIDNDIINKEWRKHVK